MLGQRFALCALSHALSLFRSLIAIFALDDATTLPN